MATAGGRTGLWPGLIPGCLTVERHRGEESFGPRSAAATRAPLVGHGGRTPQDHPDHGGCGHQTTGPAGRRGQLRAAKDPQDQDHGPRPEPRAGGSGRGQQDPAGDDAAPRLHRGERDGGAEDGDGDVAPLPAVVLFMTWTIVEARDPPAGVWQLTAQARVIGRTCSCRTTMHQRSGSGRWVVALELMVTILVGVVGLVLGYLTLRAQRTVKRLQYTSKRRPLFFIQRDEVLENVEVTSGGYRLIAPWLYLLRIENAGNTPIVPGDFTSPLIIRLRISNFALAELAWNRADVLQQSDQLAMSSREMRIGPILLNPRDRLDLTAIIDGSADDVEVTTRVAGIEEVIHAPPADEDSFTQYRAEYPLG